MSAHTAASEYDVAARGSYSDPLNDPSNDSPRAFGGLLAAICAIQAVLSLTLVWSNTAYTDEANYLWVGHLEIDHWLHGTPWPASYAYHVFSGSPIIYPPIGALAGDLGGLAAARILSLIFLIATTILLYMTATRVVGHRAAIISAAVFALSEPVIRLAFATYDPLSMLLIALSAWLVVQASCRRYGVILIAAGALALALANMTAYSGIAIDPVLIVLAFLVWLPATSTMRAVLRTVLYVAGLVAVFILLMTISHSLPGLYIAAAGRNVADHQSLSAIFSEILAYSGLVMALAIAGIVVAIRSEVLSDACLLILLGCAAFVAIAVQFHDQTVWSIDKQLAYGLWFTAIPAGYALSQLVRWLPSSSGPIVALCAVVALAYVAATSWQTAWQRYHAWPNAAPFVARLAPIAVRSGGLIYVPGHEANIAEYYVPLDLNWQRWSPAISLSPALPRSGWQHYYAGRLASGDFGVIVLFYATTFSSGQGLPGTFLTSRPRGTSANQELLGLVGVDSSEPGLSALTEAIEADKQYRAAAVGPYDSPHDYGIFVIWRRVTN